MAEIQSNIQVNVDTSEALAQLKALQRQISVFHTSLAKNTATAARAQQDLQNNLINSINATGKFAASMRTIKSTTESFTESLEKNKFSTREYFRYAAGATKSFGKLFKSEFDTIGKVAEERVKTMQTQYIKMGRNANGALQSIAVRPLTLDMEDLSTKIALAAQKQQLFGQLLKQGSTNLLNFGKNTQWAGRQLMVGFTIPLTIFGTKASQVFMDLEKQAIRFKRVYGEMFTTTEDANKALEDIRLLAQEFTKYGVAVVDTMKMAADAAASGKMGADLLAQVSEATRLAVLGAVEQEQALETTISLTNAFGIAADDLANKINFLNAVENQTVVSIEDLTIAIPKAGPVVQQLGGDVEDLAFFLTAMKEGGINASEGANALKSGLASLINPTEKAAGMLQELGININGIVNANKGNVKGIVLDFANALDQLAPLERARAIEQLFGKFQFSRLSTLFQNVTKDGTQAARVLKLAGASVEELAILSERELGAVEDATGTKFKKSMENLKQSLVPVGEQFLKAVTPIVEFVGKVLERFNNLGDGTKKALVIFTTAVGAIGPIFLMTFGLIANGAANIIKLFGTMRNGFLGLGKQSDQLAFQTQYMSSEQIEAATIAASLDQAHARLIQTFTQEAATLDLLNAAYRRAISAGQNFANANPGSMLPPIRGGKTPGGLILPGYAKGKGVQIVPGNGPGNKDTELAMLAPGEAVISAPLTKKYGPLINSMIADNIPGYKKSRPSLLQETRQSINEIAPPSQDDSGKTTTGNVRIPVGGRQFVYSTAGILAPPKVNKAPGGMTQEYLQSAMGRDAMLANVEVELQTLKNGTERTASILEEIAPILNRAIDSWSGNINAWQQAAEEATREINALQTLTQQEKDAIRRRIAPIESDYGIQSTRVYQITPEGSLTSRDERSKSAYRAEQQKRILAAKGYDVDGLVYAHMPGFEKIQKEKTSPVGAPTFSNVPPSQYTQAQKRILQQAQNEIHEYLVSVGDLKKETYEGYLAQQKLNNEVNELSTEVSKEAQQLRMSSPSAGSGTLILPNQPGFTQTGKIRTKLAKGIKKVPGTGSKDNFPAMLAPGEAVIPADMTKKYQPIIDGMVAGNIPGFADGWTGNPGSWRDSSGTTDDPFANVGVPIEPESVRRSGRSIGEMFVGVAKGAGKAIGSAIATPLAMQVQQDLAADDAEWNAEMKAKYGNKFKGNAATSVQEDPYANVGIIPGGPGATQKTGRMSGFRGRFSRGGGGLLRGGGRGRVAAGAQDLEAMRVRNQQLMQRTNMAMIGVNSMTQAASMFGGGLADKMAPFMMGLNAATMAMQMVKGPFSAAAVGVAAIAAAAIAVRKAFDSAQDKALQLTEELGAGTKSTRMFAEAAGKVSAGEIMDKRRQDRYSPYQIKTGKKTFGESFMEGEKGKELAKLVGQDIAKGGKASAQANLSARLATAVTSGAMTAEQARSVAANLGKELGDYQFSMKVNADLISVLGPKGENLLKSPLEVRTKLIEDTRARMTAGNKAAQRSARITGKDAINVGGTAAAGAGAGALAGATIGSMILPGLGTAIGAVAGTLVGGIAGAIFGNRDRKKRIGEASGASVALQKVALQQQQEMLDSLDVEYQRKIEMLKAEGKIAEAKKMQKQYDEDRLKLIKENAETTEAITTSFKDAAKTPGLQKAMLTGAKKAADRQYKGTAMEDVATLASSAITDMAIPEEQKYTLLMQMSSGQLNPTQILDMVEMFKSKKEQEQFFKISTKLGATGGADLINIINQFGGNEKLEKELTTVLSSENTTPEEAQKIMDFYNQISKVGPVLDLEIIATAAVNMSDEDKANLESVFKQVNERKGKFNLDIITKMKGVTPAQVAAVKDDYEYFDSLSEEEQKVYLNSIFTQVATVDASNPEFQSWLKTQGYSDLTLNSAGFTNKALQDFVQFKANQQTEAATDKTGAIGEGTGETKGGKRDTTFDDLLKRLKLVQDSSIKATGGLKELQRVMSGKGAISLTKFQGIDQKLLSNGKVSKEFLDFVDSLGPEGLQSDLKKFVTIGKDGLIKLNEAGKAIMRGMVAAKLGEYQVNIKNTVQALKNQTNATSKLVKAGFTFAEAQELAKDETIALAIANNQLNPEQLKKLKKETQALTKAQKDYEKVTKIALMDEMDGHKARFEAIQKFVTLQETMIENQYASQKAILGSRQDANEYALNQIGRQEDVINEKYDKQIEALEKINKLNSDINEIQNKRLSLVSALTKGDISSAASALQEFKQARAAQTAQSQIDNLRRKQEADLARVTYGGRTRKEIETDNKAIANSLTDIEEKIRLSKEKLDEQLKATIGMTRVQIQAAVAGISAALDAGVNPDDKNFLGKILNGVMGDANATKDALSKTTTEINTLIKALDDAKKKYANEKFLTGKTPEPEPTTTSEAVKQIGSKSDAIVSSVKKSIEDINPQIEKAKRDAQIEAQKLANTLLLQGKKVPAAIQKQIKYTMLPNGITVPAMFASTGGMVPKYFANGGYGRGTDIIPAMLTPGEFVVQKRAVDSLGLNAMSKINNGEIPSSSVYNYNLSVNMSGSNLNPNDVARVVMQQIRQVESQRVRGI